MSTKILNRIRNQKNDNQSGLIPNGRIISFLIFISFLLPVNGHTQGKIIAHRGASSVAPENTMVAFYKALEFGVDYIELDIRLSKDDSIMVIHDESLERTTNGTGLVKQHLYDQLKALSAGYSSKFGSDFLNEKIPSFYEVLSFTKGKAKVCIDIKNTPEFPVMDLIFRMKMENHVFIMSYNVEKLTRISTNYPQINTILLKNTLTSIDLTIADEIGAFGVSGSYFFPLTHVKRAHELGLEYWTGIIQDPAKAETLFRNKVDAILTDHPQLFSTISEEMIYVSPNPFMNSVTIQFEDIEGVQKVFISDNRGRLINEFHPPYNGLLAWTPGHNISKGLYYVNLITSEKYIFEKILFIP